MSHKLNGVSLFVVTGESKDTRACCFVTIDFHPLLGDAHRKQRRLLNPAFSVAHLRDLS